MIDDNRPNIPSPETFKHLREMLPAMAHTLAEGKIKGKGIKVYDPQPSKFCKVCNGPFAFVNSPDTIIPQQAVCQSCQRMLNDGYTALIVVGKRFAFVKSERLKDMAGAIVPISEAAMTQIAQTYQLEWQTPK